jgi:hypothetical protein
VVLAWISTIFAFVFYEANSPDAKITMINLLLLSGNYALAKGKLRNARARYKQIYNLYYCLDTEHKVLVGNKIHHYFDKLKKQG